MSAVRFLNPTTTLLWLTLLAIGWVMITSATMVGDAKGAAFTHGAYLAVGVLTFAAVICTPLDWLNRIHRLALLAALVLCILVLLPVIGSTVNGAQRWIRLGGFTLQASEVVKPLLLVYLAGYLARSGERDDLRLASMVPPALALTTLAALILLQPDFGAVVVLAAMTIGLLFVAGTRLGYFLLLVLAAAAALVVLVVAQPYRWARLVAFTDPWSYAFGSGYQLTQALIAFGRGEWLGLGLGEGVQKLFYLPEAHNDFILAVIAEELGIVGVLVVLGLLLVIGFRAFATGRRALTAKLPFAGYVSYGAGLVFTVQCLINAGVNTGLLPTKGLTLPFVSYGGNSLLVCCVLLGLVARADIEVAALSAPKSRRAATRSGGRKKAKAKNTTAVRKPAAARRTVTEDAA